MISSDRTACSFAALVCQQTGRVGIGPEGPIRINSANRQNDARNAQLIRLPGFGHAVAICRWLYTGKGKSMAATESAENYLESILVLSQEKPVVRSVDVSNYTGYRKSSISIAMKNLKADGYITISPEGYIYLTEKGMQIASMIYERHQVLSAWLIRLGVDEKTAVDDACKIEHDISASSFAAIKKYINENA